MPARIGGPSWSALAKCARVSVPVYTDWRAVRRNGGTVSLADYAAARKTARAEKVREVRGIAKRMAELPPFVDEERMDSEIMHERLCQNERFASKYAAGNSGQTGEYVARPQPPRERRAMETANTEPGGAVAPGASTTGTEETIKAWRANLMQGWEVRKVTTDAQKLTKLIQALIAVLDLTPAHRQIVRDVLGGGGE